MSPRMKKPTKIEMCKICSSAGIKEHKKSLSVEYVFSGVRISASFPLRLVERYKRFLRDEGLSPSEIEEEVREWLVEKAFYSHVIDAGDFEFLE